MKRQFIRFRHSLNISTTTDQKSRMTSSVALQRSLSSYFLQNNSSFPTVSVDYIDNKTTATKSTDLESSNTIVRGHANFSHNTCHGCGKPLRPFTTINGKILIVLSKIMTEKKFF